MDVEGQHYFWIVFLITLGAVFLLGKHVTKTWRGLFIDARCKVSLSRLQIVFWTILITSAVIWYAFISKSTNVHVPQTLWALLGISGFSTVGSEIIKGTKGENRSSPKASLLSAMSIEDESRMGLLHKNGAVKDARFTDVFKGEELLDFQTVDITKVQMFLISLFLFASYIYALLNAQNQLVACADETKEILTGLCSTTDVEIKPSTPPAGFALPGLTDGMIAMLAISHSGYLAFKAAPKTPTES